MEGEERRQAGRNLREEQERKEEEKEEDTGTRKERKMGGECQQDGLGVTGKTLKTHSKGIKGKTQAKRLQYFL